MRVNRKKLVDMSENAPGWAIGRVGFTRDVFGVDGKLPSWRSEQMKSWMHLKASLAEGFQWQLLYHSSMTLMLSPKAMKAELRNLIVAMV